MTDPLWTDKLQAIGSALTALFTLASLIYLAVYTETTRKAQTTARDAFEEGVRPVVLVVRVRTKAGQRLATLKNTGAGIAVNLRRTATLAGGEAHNNVLARSRLLLMVIPSELENNFLELRYESLTGKKLCTICYFLEDGRTFNDYIPDAAGMKDGELKSRYSSLMGRAMLAQSTKTASDFRALQK